MNAAFLMKLAEFAIEHGPEVVDKIRNLIKKYGDPVDAERYETALETLRKDPNEYFGERRPDDNPVEPQPEDPQDPTAPAYATAGEAIAVAQTMRGYLVTKYVDGTFHLWPTTLGPVPGDIVWQP